MNWALIAYAAPFVIIFIIMAFNPFGLWHKKGPEQPHEGSRPEDQN